MMKVHSCYENIYIIFKNRIMVFLIVWTMDNWTIKTVVAVSLVK